MRVLVVHNRYSSRAPSGENLAVQDEVRWLRDAGVDVHTHEVSNDDVFEAGIVQRIGQATSALWSVPAQRRMVAVIDRTEPDLVHIHNLFPLLSASVPWVATRRGLPVVWTVHNRRVTCVIGTNFRDGQPCYDCRPGWRVPGIRHRCYGGGSIAASALATGASSIFRGVARRRVTALAVSDNIRQWLLDTAGFAPDRVHVKHNGIAEPSVSSSGLPPVASRRTFLLAGYLIEHKGIPLLLDAWQRTGDLDAELRIVGDGPLTETVANAASEDPRITWIPQVPPEKMPAHLAEARAVVVPSTWEDPLPRSAAEALAYGRPVITTGMGGLNEIVDAGSGWVTGTDTASLAEALLEAASSDQVVTTRGAAARKRYEDLFSPTSTTRSLVQFYENARSQATSTASGRPL